jgi:DNA polymerase alpha subunit B
VPNTPRVGSSNKAGTRRKFETPSLTRVKAEPASSPPDFKTPYKPGEQNGQAYAEMSSTQTQY